MGHDQGLGDGQPDAGSSMSPITRGVDPVETFEDMRQMLGGDALAGVRDGQLGITRPGRQGG